jgi:MFS family permease
MNSLGRRILAILVGFIAMLVVAIALLAGAYSLLGPDRYFQQGSYNASVVAIVTGFIVAIISALFGGWVASRIGGRTAVRMLAFLFVVLGFASAIPTIQSHNRSDPRSPEVSEIQAMQMSKNPHWVTFLHPLVGGAGVLVGGTWRRRTNV